METEVNYITHLNSLFARMAADDRLTPHHISLYLALFQMWNLNLFRSPVSISRGEIMQISKIGSNNTYSRCLKQLHEFGYIIYRPSKNPVVGSTVSCIRFDTSDDTSAVHLTIHQKGASYKQEKTRETFKRKKLVKPAQDEVQKFFVEDLAGKATPEINLGDEAEKFFNHFTANGWKVGGKTPMKDWKAAARNWLINAKRFAAQKKPLRADHLQTNTAKITMSRSENHADNQDSLFPEFGGSSGAGTVKPYRITNNVRNYSWPLCLQWLEIEGKARFGKHFKIYPKDHDLIYKLAIYFIADKAEAKRLNLSLKKGILLTGPIGCGKTSLMKLFSNFPGTPGYKFRSCRQLATAFMKLGFELIEHYSNTPVTTCFDDLGTEQSLKYFGNDTNVMGEILLSRYERFADMGIKTHCTTNLNASELEAAYGNRLRSRLRESFNLLTLESGDKRT